MMKQATDLDTLAGLDEAGVFLIGRRAGWFWAPKTAAEHVRRMGDGGNSPEVRGPFLSAVEAARHARDTLGLQVAGLTVRAMHGQEVA